MPGCALLGLLFAGAGCYRAEISQLPRDRGPLPAPSYEWNPERGEVHEFPIPPASRWNRTEQERVAKSLAGQTPRGATPLVAVYDTDSPRATVEKFYEGFFRHPAALRGTDALFAESGLLPEVVVSGTSPVRITLVKILPAGLRPPERAAAQRPGA